MEGSGSLDTSVAPEPDKDAVDVSSQADEKEEVTNEDAEKIDDSGKPAKAGEFKKTWGFRRTTIAKREMPAETESQDSRSAPVRRSGRQAKRTDKLEEFLSTAKRGRGGRRSAPGHLETWDTPSQTPTDVETASEASFDGNAATDERKPDSKAVGRKKDAKGGSVSEDGSSENEENAETVPLKAEEPEEHCMGGPEADAQEPVSHVSAEEDGRKAGEDETSEQTTAGTQAASKDSTPGKKASKPRRRAKSSKDNKGEEEEDDDDDDDDDDEEEESSGKSDNEGYDPNALYCICRQKHNKRFMICCDRCEEWFHGDCVGITEARGRLMERNGEDYICPNCSARKSQAASPADSGKRTARRTRQSSPADRTVPSPGSEDKASEDLGIKGRIEKATNPSGKKKIKIFQPAVETASLPKCIGPGCEKAALPDSVYCGNDCILRHAAAAMKSITDVKESKPKEKAKVKAQKKPTARAAPKKKSASERRNPGRKSTESSGKAEDDASDSEDEDDDDDNEDPRPIEQEPPVSSWSSDHNYNAVTPEKAAPVTSSVYNKSCMYHLKVCHTSPLYYLPLC